MRTRGFVVLNDRKGINLDNVSWYNVSGDGKKLDVYFANGVAAVVLEGTEVATFLKAVGKMQLNRRMRM
jgi:hypothetical protein